MRQRAHMPTEYSDEMTGFVDILLRAPADPGAPSTTCCAVAPFVEDGAKGCDEPTAAAGGGTRRMLNRLSVPPAQKALEEAARRREIIEIMRKRARIGAG